MGEVESDKSVATQVPEPVPEPVQLCTHSAEQTADVGRRLASVLRSGDVVILAGGLGAGKTTLTQGIGAGLGVRGEVTSPTFVISRVHPAQQPAKPSLVHVDAYRLGGRVELDDLDVDAYVDDAVIVVEWGEGLAEPMSADRLQVDLGRGAACGHDDRVPGGKDPDATRVITVTPVGSRWVGVPLGALLAYAG